MAERASELRTLLPCPRCGRSLVPASVHSPVTFRCKSGHDVALADLLKTQSLVLRRGLEDLLAEWSLQRESLLRTVEQARRNGHLDVAEIFKRHAESLEHRIVHVRNAFATSDSGRLIVVPDASRLA